MTRILLHYVLPLALPAVMYMVWAMIAQHRGKSVTETMAGLRQGPWFWLMLGGFLLMIASLVTFGLTTGSPADRDYSPPRLEDGKVVPGSFDPKRQ